MPTLTAKTRTGAARIQAILEDYAHAIGESGEAVDLTTVRDLIQDIMHWELTRRDDGDAGAAAESVFNAAVEAYRDFPNEVQEEE